MSFQAYIDNIKRKTGKTPEDFMRLMKKKGLFAPDMKASVLVTFLAKEFDVGHGHAMAIWAVFKDEGWVNKNK
ncbi:MAG: DUF4287 domain-containing protein [Minisyncoccia bacterium]